MMLLQREHALFIDQHNTWYFVKVSIGALWIDYWENIRISMLWADDALQRWRHFKPHKVYNSKQAVCLRFTTIGALKFFKVLSKLFPANLTSALQMSNQTTKRVEIKRWAPLYLLSTALHCKRLDYWRKNASKHRKRRSARPETLNRSEIGTHRDLGRTDTTRAGLLKPASCAYKNRPQARPHPSPSLHPPPGSTS